MGKRVLDAAHVVLGLGLGELEGHTGRLEEGTEVSQLGDGGELFWKKKQMHETVSQQNTKAINRNIAITYCTKKLMKQNQVNCTIT